MEFLQRVSRPHPFKVKPGYDWWKGFLKRWPQLTERKAQSLSKKRAEGANRNTLEEFFERVEALLTKIGIRHAHDLSDRLWNCDETGLCNASASCRILAKKRISMGSLHFRWIRTRLHHCSWVWFCLWYSLAAICSAKGEAFVLIMDQGRSSRSNVFS